MLSVVHGKKVRVGESARTISVVEQSRVHVSKSFFFSSFFITVW